MKYLARITDGAIFKENEDGTFSMVDSLMASPYRYSKDQLSYPMFEEVTEKDFPYLKKRMKEYYSYLAWANRNDGHGGCKGGTIEEFREKFKK
jgi:hypothetical protein